MESVHPSLPRPDCNSTADVPSFNLRTALSTIPFVSDLCGVDVQWFHDNSSQPCQIPRHCQCKWLLVSSSAPGTSLGSSGSPGNFLVYTGRTVTTVLPNLVPPRHIDDCHAIHFLHWEFGDPLWSNHQNLSDLGTTVPARLLQEALVIFVFKQISQCGSFGKCV